MPAPLSPEGVVKSFLNETKLDSTRFAEIAGAGLNSTSMSNAMNDLKPFTREQAEAALNCVAKLNMLLVAAEPLPLNLKDAKVIRKLLAAQEAGTLKISVEINRGDWDQTPE